MNAQPDTLGDEFCPRCGKWVDELREFTGWCVSCSGLEVPDGQVCVRCEHPRPAEFYSQRTRNGRKVCRYCRSAKRMAWKHRHAEHTLLYERQRKRERGRGVCPVCGYSKPLTASGALQSHQANTSWRAGQPACAGTGMPRVVR